MLKKITIVAFSLLFTCTLIAQTSNAVRLNDQSVVKEGELRTPGIPFYEHVVPPTPFWNAFIPTNSVPGLVGFSDYATNGNTLNQIVRSNDTIVVSFIYLDSAEARNANGGTSVRIAYNFSYDGGLTWQSATRTDISAEKSRWPDLAYLSLSGNPTISASGRLYNGATRYGGVIIEPSLGAGSGSGYFIPGTGQAGNTDYFTDKMVNGKLAGVWERNDTIYYQTFDPVTTTYGPQQFLYKVVATNFVASYDVYSSQISNTVYSFFDFTNETIGNGGSILYPIYRYKKSTDNGATWTAPAGILDTYVLQGDSMKAYWHQDAGFKPGTDTPFLVFSTKPTIGYGNFNPGGTLLDSNRRGYNILIWSPTLNGGTPVRIASYLNIDVLSDTNKFKMVTRLRTIQGVANIFALQVNSNIVSHPSIGFSTDGSVIHVAFAVAQTDTSTEGFNYFDIFTTRSTDGGATWTTPQNITNTPAQDEMYPVVAKYTNSATVANVTYQSTAVPGCQGFGNSSTIESQIIAPVYQCFQGPGPIGIINVGNGVPKTFALEQNYPNPFNPTTKIRFSVPKAASITIEVFDITGKLVATIAKNENVSAGLKEVEFNASGIASGIYFYKLSTEGFTATKKMVLVK